MTDVNNQESWNRSQEISTFEIDQAVMLMKTVRESYEAARAVAQKINEELEKVESHLISLLEQAGKSKYFVENLGTVNLMNKYSVKTPKELSQKEAFFAWISDNYGVETLKGMLSIHSATLNSFVNEVKTTNALTEIPGLDAPTHQKIIRFTAKK